MEQLHNDLSAKYNWYKRWHENNNSKVWHWVVFVCLAVFVGIYLVNVIPKNITVSNSTAQAQSTSGDQGSELADLTRQVLNLAHDYKFRSVSGKPALLAQLHDLVLQRKNLMLQQTDSNPKGVLNNSISGVLRSQMPAGVQNLVEQKTSLTGKFKWIHMDGNNDQATNIFTLTNNANKEYTLHFGANLPNLLTDDNVDVSGELIDNHLIVETARNNARVLGANTPVVRKVAVIMFNFLSNPVQPFTADTMRANTFTASNSANNYYQEDSFGQLSLTGSLRTDGDVFGWYTISNSNATCDYSSWASAAESAAAADGYSASKYNSIVFAFPNVGACGWSGAANVGGNPARAWLNGSVGLRTIAHELGHNFGRYHAHTYTCTDASGAYVALSASCTQTEYGDPFDIMGYPGVTGEYNAFQKSVSSSIPSWWAGSNIVNVTADGDYTIAPLESNTSSPQFLRILRDTTNYFYVEFRQSIGYDSNVSATGSVQVHYSSPSSNDSSRLIDMTPSATPNNFSDAGLAVGSVYTDNTSGIEITTVSTSPTAAVVHVHFGPAACVNTSPSASLSPSPQTLSSGQTVAYNMTLKNNDNSTCTATTFAVTPTLPSGWIATPASLTQTLTPSQSVTTVINVTSPATSTAGNYTITEKAVSTIFSSLTASASATASVVVPDVTPPTVSITSPVSGSKVTAASVTISATASDNTKVTKVEISVDSKLQVSDTASPYSYKWNTNKTASGTHTITAKAYDAAGNTTTASITVTK